MKTLLLCFIHGFRGDEETFYQFPLHLQDAVSKQLPDIAVKTAVYPKYDTKGDLALAVQGFREWLQDRVGDIERDSQTPSPIYSPSVNVIIIAHSMGGLVAADALFLTLDDRPISPDPNDPDKAPLFPHIRGLLAFDTPYNGLARSLFAYGAFSQYRNLSSIYSIASAIPASYTLASSSLTSISTTAGLKGWQLLAARTGTAGVIVAGGVAAYTNRNTIRASLASLNKENFANGLKYISKDNVAQGLAYVSWESIGAGFAWTSSHLKFVGALMKPTQMRIRLQRLHGISGVGKMDFYTSLNGEGKGKGWTEAYLKRLPKRTFCAVPKGEEEKWWVEWGNAKAADEIEAHCSMFKSEANESYEEMVEAAGRVVTIWAKSKEAARDGGRPNKEQQELEKKEGEQVDDDGVSQVDEMDFGDDECELFQKALEVPLPPDAPEGEDDDEMEGEAMSEPVDEELGGSGDLTTEEQKREVELFRQALGVPLPLDEKAMDQPANDEAKATEASTTSAEKPKSDEETKSGEGKTATSSTGRLYQGISKLGTWTGLVKQKT